MATGALVAAGLTVVPGTASANGDCVSYWASSWSGAPAPGGTGTEQDPYKVGSQLDLNEIRWCPAANFQQISDIALTGDWTPIVGEGGAAGDPFTGTYFGAGYAITGLTVNLPAQDNVGLFETLAGTAKVWGVIASNVSVTGRYVAGGIAGSIQDSAVVQDSVISGTVTTTLGRSGGVAGQSVAIAPGAVGAADTGPQIADTSSTVSVSGEQDVGGFVGRMEAGSVIDSDYEGTVTGSDRLGGVAGYLGDSEIARTAVDGTVTGVYYVGGVTGLADQSQLSELAVDGTVTASDRFAGGIAGRARLTDISKVATYGTMSAPAMAGGVAGDLFQGTTLTDAAADVTVTGDTDLGGLTGAVINSTVTDSVAAGSVSGQDRIGGLAGGLSGQILRSSAAVAVTASGDDVGGVAGFMAPPIDVCGSGVDQAWVCAQADPVAIEIRQSYATGAVQGRSYAGGLVGRLTDDAVCPGGLDVQACAATPAPTSTIYDSYATGAVTATDVAGGLVGGTGSIAPVSAGGDRVVATAGLMPVVNTYASGVVTGATRGGVVGDNSGGAWVYESFWDVTANPQITTGEGKPKTQAQLSDITTFTKAQWLIQAGAPKKGNNLWGICVPPDPSVSDGYPFLLWQHTDADPCHPVPAAPVLKTLTPGNRSLEVTATLGASGGKPVTAVEYQLDGGAWRDSGGTTGSFTIGGLTNGRTYEVRVRAVNAIGPSKASNELSGTPAGTTSLFVQGRSTARDLPVDERSVLVRFVRTNGQILVAKVFCTLKGNRLPRRLAARLCAPTVSGPGVTAAGADVTAAKKRKKKLHITAKPACSQGLRVQVRIAAKAKGAPRETITRTYAVDRSPAVTCRIRGTG